MKTDQLDSLEASRSGSTIFSMEFIFGFILSKKSLYMFIVYVH